ncbi:MAG TPA: thioredoxin domain-containing protein, partial [Candidatus Sulfomarinibacteraceae bacterium]|nr:thioredoxin domain-containing protein [Candidatus Sulfomarinibacteraceae bacterium]
DAEMGGLLLAVLLSMPGTAPAECGLECERRATAELINRGETRAAFERLKNAARRYPDDRGLVLQLACAYPLIAELASFALDIATYDILPLAAVDPAAIVTDRFWPFMLSTYRHFDDHAAERQPEWAAASGLDRDEFAARLENAATRDAVVASKKEGLVNGVEEAPTLFIDGRRWAGDLELEELISAVEEAAAQARGRLCGSD